MTTQTPYPLSTADGKFIPLDVVSPIAVWKFSLSPDIVSTLKTLDTINCLLSCKSSTDALLRFGPTNASIPANEAKVDNTAFLPGNTLIVVNPSDLEFSLISPNAATVWIQVMERWESLSKQVLVNRR